jgi:LysM repeat protein
MNNPNPFVPKGSLLEQQSQRRSRLKLAVFCVVAVCVTGLVAMLIQGCKREQPATESGLPPMDATNPMAMDYTNPPVETNPPTPIPAFTNPPPLPVPPVPVPQAIQTSGEEYIVVAGDTFGKIAKAHGVSLKALEDANPGVDSRKLKIKQKITIPPSAKSTEAAPPAVAGAADMGGQTYTVKSGDTLTKIAKANGTTVKAIEAANPGVDPNHIKVAQKLKIPAKAEAAAPAPVETAPAPMAPPASMPVPATPGNTN